MKVVDQLSEYLQAARNSDLPPEVVRKAKHHILDTVAAMISGASLRPGRLAIRYGRSQRGRREASVMGSDLMLPASTAALVNGILAHADETDDTHWRSRTHPGCAIVPPHGRSRRKKTRRAEHLSTRWLPATTWAAA